MSQPQGARNGVHGADGATFEQCYTRLQEVVQRLSMGNLTLPDALAAFEEGMSLAEKCQQMLDQAELRVKQVSARATRGGADAIENLDARNREAVQGSVIEVETLEQRVVIEPGPAVAPAPRPAAGNPAFTGQPQGQVQRPAQPPAPPTSARPQTGPLKPPQVEDVRRRARPRPSLRRRRLVLVQFDILYALPRNVPRSARGEHIQAGSRGGPCTGPPPQYPALHHR